MNVMIITFLGEGKESTVLTHITLPCNKCVVHRKNARKAGHCPGGFPLAQGSMLENYSLQPPYVLIAAVSLLIAMLLWECTLM